MRSVVLIIVHSVWKSGKVDHILELIVIMRGYEKENVAQLVAQVANNVHIRVFALVLTTELRFEPVSTDW